MQLFNSQSYASSTHPTHRMDLEWWQQRHHEILERHKQGGREINVVFIGDSITQRWEQSGAALWSRLFKPMGASNLGFDGDKTEHVLWRIEQGELDHLEPKLVVLMIGTNNTWSGIDKPVDTANGIRAILHRLLHKLKNTKVLVLGVFPAFEANSKHRQDNKRVNELISDLHDGDRVYFEDISSLFVEDDLSISPKVMPDGIHLSQEGYSLWAKYLKDKFEGLKIN